MIVSLIIARKGSQRLPGKNWADLCGRPLVEWSIIQAKCSHLIDEVIVGTDSEAVAEIAEEHGCNVFWRENVTDGQVGNTAFMQLMDWWEARNGPPEAYVTTLPTSPLRMPDHFDRGVRRFREGDCEFVMWIDKTKEHFALHNVYDGDRVRWVFPCRFDKAWNYSWCFGGDGIATPTIYRKASEYCLDHEGSVQAWRGLYGALEVEHWQVMFEIDTAEDLEMTRFVMKHKILDKLGGDCYERYAQQRYS